MIESGEFRSASDDEIEVRVNLVQKGSAIEYRPLLLNDPNEPLEWKSTPFQAAEVHSEDQALSLVSRWLETSYGD
ncbi:hypothetical protein [Parachitinimonas caeni]|uniref:Uncharacterized protein n=1 Tax=Parachitinimonas caeni TaxID=3031301 RepID=A0ABT7E3S6_9NEIS|nr:hypothetical protein [Parachitinimonas caeni]MDK2126699.1 hypothetical protein [Parachitinimonas caeni]